jgi:hypothetical protein
MGVRPKLVVFLLGERQRVDDAQVQLAVGLGDHFLQQLAHARGVGTQALQLRHVGADAVGEEEVQVHRLVQVAQDLHRAVGERVEPVLGEVQADTAQQQVADQQDGQQQDAQQHQTADGGRTAGKVDHGGLLLSRPSSSRPGSRWRTTRRRS